VLLLAISLAVALALCEGLLRLAWTNPYRTEQPDRVLVLRLPHAGRQLPIDRAALYPDSPVTPLRTDERSYILPSRRFPDPDYTIAFLGGSTTECAAVREELRFPALVSSLLEARGLRVNTLNAGLSGNTTHDALNVLLNHVVFDRPQAVVLMEAVNDLGMLRAAGSYAPRAGETASAGSAARWLLQSASARSSLAGLVRLLATTRGVERPAPATPALAAREPAAVDLGGYTARLRAFVGLCRAFGIEPVLMTQPASSARNALTPDWLDAAEQDALNAEVRRVAAEAGATLIDLARHLTEDVPGWDEPMRVLYDGLHVTEDGSRIYADYVARRLQQTLLAGHAPATN
jgi:lysophospholipase L1-like esterase